MLSDRVEEILRDQVSIDHLLRVYNDVQAFDDVQYGVLRLSMSIGAWEVLIRRGMLLDRSLGLNRGLFRSITGGFCIDSKRAETPDLIEDASIDVLELRRRTPYSPHYRPTGSLRTATDCVYLLLMECKDLIIGDLTWRLPTR